jgi:RNA polymerase sigma factor (sigma-70 family)
MNAPVAPPGAEHDLLVQIRSYLRQRDHGLPVNQDLDAAWTQFFDRYDRKIRVFAFRCGATDDDIADCVQEVWTELLRRLPAFRLDPERGRFDTWLFNIVRGKAVDLHRSHHHPLWQDASDRLQSVPDHRPRPGDTLEEEEMVRLALEQLRTRLSDRSFQVLYLRLVDQRPVTEVAEMLGLSHEQVWYRYHRARRELEAIGSALATGQRSPSPVDDAPLEKKGTNQEFAQGMPTSLVSRNGGPKSGAHPGGKRVDYVFQKLELGRRELSPEWRVEWNSGTVPRPVLYIRKMAMVAYAEMCGSGEFMNSHWPRIANAAIAAGVAAGIATIMTAPSTALPIFQVEFRKQLQGNGDVPVAEQIQVALSAKQEANGPWSVCNN